MSIEKFLSWARPEGPWHLVSIDPSKKSALKGEVFSSAAEAAEWAVKENQSKNVYWTVNRLQRAVRTKPSRDDILTMDWIHVDVDPRPRADLEAERRRIRTLLDNFEPKPSAVVFSGGGYQAFWRLKDPLPINGREDLYEEAKRYNRQMEIRFDADQCHNVDRIMRLPGTTNWPDAKKQEKGRTPTLAKVVETNDNVYDISDFVKAPHLQQNTGFSGNTVHVSGNVQRLDTLDELPVSDACKNVIAQGFDPDDPARWNHDRSKAQWWVTCEMVRANVDDDTIFSVLTDPDWGVSGHILDQRRPDEYAIRQIEKAREEAIAPELRELNAEYAVTIVGSRVRILRESKDPGENYPSVNFMTSGDFSVLLQNRQMIWLDGKGEEKKAPLAKWWLGHELRRTYQGITFLPGKEVPGFYNLWRGFAYDAIPGDCSAFLNHVRDNICQGNEDWYQYLLGWMAHATQHPDQPGHTAVVFRGKQGTGKGFFAHHFGRLFGRHYLPVKDSAHIFGQFNGHLQDCVILFADESFWVDSTKQKSMLKNMITEPDMMVERKGQDAQRGRNCVHLIMASNEKWVVPLEGQDRRFFVLDVGEQHLQDNDYFGRIADQMENGGYEALLHMLLTHDLSEFDIRRIPQTKAAAEQKSYSMPSDKQWWFYKLCEGSIYEDTNGWPEFVWATELCFDYIQHMSTWDRTSRSNQTRLGCFLKDMIPGLGNDKEYASGEHSVVQANGDIRRVVNPRIYRLPSLEECRSHWDREFGTVEWPKATAVDVEVHENTGDAF